MVPVAPGEWILGHLDRHRIHGVMMAVVFLVVGGDPSGGSLLAIVLAVYLGWLRLVAAWTRGVRSRIWAGVHPQSQRPLSPAKEETKPIERAPPQPTTDCSVNHPSWGDDPPAWDPTY